MNEVLGTLERNADVGIRVHRNADKVGARARGAGFSSGTTHYQSDVRNKELV